MVSVAGVVGDRYGPNGAQMGAAGRDRPGARPRITSEESVEVKRLLTADLVLDAIEQAIWTRRREGRDQFDALADASLIGPLGPIQLLGCRHRGRAVVDEHYQPSAPNP